MLKGYMLQWEEQGVKRRSQVLGPVIQPWEEIKLLPGILASDPKKSLAEAVISLVKTKTCWLVVDFDHFQMIRML